jgi:hypothetical protein
MSAHHRIYGQGHFFPHNPVHAETGLRHPARGGRPTSDRWLLRSYRGDESMIDGLRCYGGIYLYRLEVGGYMVDLIWYLSVIEL